MTDYQYINDPGFEVPENNILVVPMQPGSDGFFKDIIDPLKGQVTREWFNEHFYYCLPINIGNQYGFVIRSQRTFEMIWDGTENNPNDVTFNFLDGDLDEKQIIKNGFSMGVVTIQNHFALKTPPGINLMTIQPPNMFIPGCIAMTGVIETDQIRRDFTFNLKITVPNMTIRVNKGDALGAFIPIPRYFVDKFEVKHVLDVFSEELYRNELMDASELSRQRNAEDKDRPHQSGRKYFQGTHAFGEKFIDHQKRVR